MLLLISFCLTFHNIIWILIFELLQEHLHILWQLNILLLLLHLSLAIHLKLILQLALAHYTPTNTICIITRTWTLIVINIVIITDKILQIFLIRESLRR